MKSADVIERYVTDEVAKARGRAGIAHEDDLLELGLLDSISIVRLVRFLEERFEIEIQDDDLMPEKFRTIAAITALVEARLEERRVA